MMLMMASPSREPTAGGAGAPTSSPTFWPRRPTSLVFFAGCSEEQAELQFDFRVLLTAPRSVLVRRLRTRTNNAYGRDDRELAQVFADLEEVEPLLRRSADLVLATTAPTAAMADVLLRRIAERHPGLA
jgi:hypothetical protein